MVIDITESDTAEGTLDSNILTFTTSNWNVAQTVTLTAIDDEIDRDDSMDVTVSVDAASSDVTYGSVVPEVLNITLTDDDTAAYTLDTTSLTIDENGGT